MARHHSALVVCASAILVGLAVVRGAGLALAGGSQVPVDVRLVAVSTRETGIAQIWVFNIDGSGGRALTSGSVAHYSPKVSPDRTKIAFTGGDGGGSSIFVVDVAGGAMVRLTRPPLIAGTPAWAPDGSRIVFVGAVTVGKGYQLWTMKPDGTDQRQLTHLPNMSVASPAFSPDGTTIAFVGTTTSAGGVSASSIDTVRADGSGEAAVTNGPSDGYPAWVDSTRLLFAAANPEDTKSQVFLKKLGGSETPESPTGAFYTEPVPSADGTTYFATGHANGGGLGLFRVLLNNGAGPSGGTPITIAGGGDTYSPVLIAEPTQEAPSASSVGSAAPSVPAIPSAAQPSGAVSIAVPGGSGGRPSLNIWEILIGVGIVAVVIGGTTYWVKLRPEKDGCDPQRAAVLAAEAEFTAAQAAFDAAEAVHDKAVAARHNADGQVNWVSDQPLGPKVEQAEAAQAAAQSAEADAYQALVKAGTRQGAARINLDVARKRLADCVGLNVSSPEADPRTSAPHPPSLTPGASGNAQTQTNTPSVPPPGPARPPDTAEPERPARHHRRGEGGLPVSLQVTGEPPAPAANEGFDPVPPAPTPEVPPENPYREIG